MTKESPSFRDGDRPRPLHGLRCVHDRVRRREQHPAGAAEADDRTGITWMRVTGWTTAPPFRRPNRSSSRSRASSAIELRRASTVCPQKAVELDPKTGIVAQIAVRCLGCRYCMAACPYHARYFNWGDPEWPEGMEATLNPDVSPRMSGVGGEMQLLPRAATRSRGAAARPRAHDDRASGLRPRLRRSVPRRGRITFGDLNDPAERGRPARRRPELLPAAAGLGTEPKVYYRSRKPWVRELAPAGGRPAKRRSIHG